MTIEMEYATMRQQFIVDYQNLRELFITIAKPHVVSTDLNNLKITYSSVIKSARVSDYIKSVEELLRILEKRNALSYDNIEPLKHISSTFIKDPVLERALRDYEARNQRRSPLPPCNVYDMASGKYSRKTLRSRNFVTADRSIVPGSNRSESVNDNAANYCNCVVELPGGNESSPEDRLINETETFVQNDPATTVQKDRRNVANGHVYAVKVDKKICSKFGMGVTGALLGTGVIIVLITVSNVLSVKSVASAPQLESQPGVSGVQTRFNRSQQRRQELHAQMTLYTTQPAFHLTLPGTILFSHTTSQSSKECDSEDVRMVLLEISEKLGKGWRNVARFLGVKEHDIDEIDHKHDLSLKEKAFKALQIFQSKCDPLQWKMKLKRALDKARRRDLMEMVDELSGKRSLN